MRHMHFHYILRQRYANTPLLPRIDAIIEAEAAFAMAFTYIGH